MIDELYCSNCDNDELFIVEYYNTLMDSDTIRDLMSNDVFEQTLERGSEEHIVRIDCTECAEKLYD